MVFYKGQVVFWLGLQGLVEAVDDFGIQVKFMEFSPKFNKPIERWITFNEDGTYLTGQREGLSYTQGVTAQDVPMPDYDIIQQLNELDSKLQLTLDSVEELLESHRGTA